MPHSLSVWLDDKTAEKLEKLAEAEHRTRSNMVKVLIREAARISGTKSIEANSSAPE